MTREKKKEASRNVPNCPAVLRTSGSKFLFHLRHKEKTSCNVARLQFQKENTEFCEVLISWADLYLQYM